MTPSVAIRRPGRVPYWFTTLGIRVLVRAYLRVRVEGQPLPPGPAILCFSHQSWADPFVAVAALPSRPDLWFFGPKEADMSAGVRNRLIAWSGRAVPVNPERTNLLEATRRVEVVLATGAIGRPTRDAVHALTVEVRTALLALVSDGRDEAAPGPVGRWVTELFNDWPAGRRPALPDVSGESS